MVRNDTYIVHNPDEPQPRTFDEAMAIKIALKNSGEGWRVKIRKNVDGEYVVWKKHDELLHTDNRRAV